MLTSHRSVRVPLFSHSPSFLSHTGRPPCSTTCLWMVDSPLFSSHTGRSPCSTTCLWMVDSPSFSSRNRPSPLFPPAVGWWIRPQITCRWMVDSPSFPSGRSLLQPAVCSPCQWMVDSPSDSLPGRDLILPPAVRWWIRPRSLGPFFTTACCPFPGQWIRPQTPSQAVLPTTACCLILLLDGGLFLKLLLDCIID